MENEKKKSLKVWLEIEGARLKKNKDKIKCTRYSRPGSSIIGEKIVRLI